MRPDSQIYMLLMLFNSKLLIIPQDKNAFYDAKHQDRRHHAASTVADKRKRHTGQRDKFASAADSQKRLKQV